MQVVFFFVYQIDLCSSISINKYFLANVILELAVEQYMERFGFNLQSDSDDKDNEGQWVNTIMTNKWSLDTLAEYKKQFNCI